MSKINLSAECDFEDTKLRAWASKLNKKIENMNERTLKHTLEIRELKKQIKEQKKS